MYCHKLAGVDLWAERIFERADLRASTVLKSKRPKDYTVINLIK